MAPTERTALVSRSETRIRVKRQCELAGANRSSVYHRDMEEGKKLSHGENAANLSLMRQLDELHMTYPAWEYHKLTAYLRNNGFVKINAKRVHRLLRMMGIAALYPKPNLSKRLHAKYVRPYLLKELTIDHVDQVWGIDITYFSEKLKEDYLGLFHLTYLFYAVKENFLLEEGKLDKQKKGK